MCSRIALFVSFTLLAGCSSGEASSPRPTDPNAQAPNGTAPGGTAPPGTNPGETPPPLQSIPSGHPYSPVGNNGVIEVLAGEASSLVPDGAGGLFVSDGNRVTRIDGTGALDPNVTKKALTYPLAGSASPLALTNARLGVQPTGGALYAGYVVKNFSTQVAPQLGVVRIDAKGNADSSFGEGGSAGASFGVTSLDPQQIHFAVGADGSFAITIGAASSAPAEERAKTYIAQFGPQGNLIGTYTPTIAGLADVDSLAIGADGKILLGGASGGAGSRPVVVRLAAGALDSSYGAGGKAFVGTSGGYGVRDILVQPDGKVLAVTDSPVLARFDANGNIDSTFGIQGTALAGGLDVTFGDPTVRLALQKDGKIVVAASTGSSGSGSSSKRDVQAARFDAGGHLDTAFGDNGVSLPFSVAPMADKSGPVAVLPSGLIVVAGFRFEDEQATQAKDYGALFAIAP